MQVAPRGQTLLSSLQFTIITHLDKFGVHLRLKTVIVHPHAYIYHYILTVDICSTCHVFLSSPVNLQRCLYRMVSQYMYFFTFSLFGEV